MLFLEAIITYVCPIEIIEEYSEVLSRNISPQVSEAIVYAILTRPNIIRKDPHYTFALIEADKDDNKFVDCAIAANAKCIVTEDKHLKKLPICFQMRSIF